MIRLPWVSRARYELLEHNSRELVVQLKVALAVADARAKSAEDRGDRFFEAIRELRLAGANPKDELLHATPKPPDPVLQAILAKAGRSLLLRKHYAEFVAGERALGKSEDEIAKAILDGQDMTNEGLPA